jgi:hypothetical protein
MFYPVIKKADIRTAMIEGRLRVISRTPSLPGSGGSRGWHGGVKRTMPLAISDPGEPLAISQSWVLEAFGPQVPGKFQFFIPC